MQFLKTIAILAFFPLVLSCHSDKDRSVLYTDLIKDYKGYDEMLEFNIQGYIWDIKGYIRHDRGDKRLSTYLDQANAVMQSTKALRDSVQQVHDNPKIKGKDLQKCINGLLDNYRTKLLEINGNDFPYDHNSVNQLFNQVILKDKTDYGAYIVDQIQGDPNRRSLLLKRLRYELHTMEYEMVQDYSISSGPDCNFGADMISFIRSMHLSKRHVHAGEDLSVFITSDYYGSKNTPSLIVNHKTIQGKDGVVKYTFKAQGSPGRKSLPLIITYTDPDGLKSADTVSINYNIIP